MKYREISMSLVVAAMMSSCAGGGQQGGGTAMTIGEDAKGLAKEIYKQIDKENLPDYCRAFDSEGQIQMAVDGESIPLTQTDAVDKPGYMWRSVMGSDGSGYEDFVGGLEIKCFPLETGGYKAYVLAVKGSVEMVLVDRSSAYVWRDGKLVAAENDLPRPSGYDFVDAVSDLEGDELRMATNKPAYQIEFTDGGVEVSLPIGQTLEKTYTWNGKGFDLEKETMDVVSINGVGTLKLGREMPETMDGYEERWEGKRIFLKEGKDMFSLEGDGYIDCVNVLSPRYVMSVPEGEGVGNIEVGVGMKMEDVKKAHFEDLGYKVESFDKRDGEDDGQRLVITDEASMREMTFHAPDADGIVKAIYIYELEGDFGEESGDAMEIEPNELKRQFVEYAQDPMLTDGRVEYWENGFSYTKEMYSDKCDGYCDYVITKVYFYNLRNGGLKAYEVEFTNTNLDDGATEQGYSEFSAYTYKDGKFEQVDVEKDLTDMGKVTDVEFRTDGIKVTHNPVIDGQVVEGVEENYDWNGTEMEANNG